MSLFYDYDQDVPLNPLVVASVDSPGYRRDKFVIRGHREASVTGYLAVPTSDRPPVPLVVMLHGSGGSKEVWWDRAIRWDLTSALLSSGFAVLALDGKHRGERQPRDLRPPPTKRMDCVRLRDLGLETVIDYRRALDYASTRSELDTTRIGLVGYSLGGVLGYGLTTFDDRIQAAVLCVGRPDLPGRLEPFSPYRFASLLAQRPILLLMGRSDFFYSVDHVERFHAMVPSSELIWYESGHQLPAGHVRDAVQWLTRQLLVR